MEAIRLSPAVLPRATRSAASPPWAPTSSMLTADASRLPDSPALPSCVDGHCSVDNHEHPVTSLIGDGVESHVLQGGNGVQCGVGHEIRATHGIRFGFLVLPPRTGNEGRVPCGPRVHAGVPVVRREGSQVVPVGQGECLVANEHRGISELQPPRTRLVHWLPNGDITGDRVEDDHAATLLPFGEAALEANLKGQVLEVGAGNQVRLRLGHRIIARRYKARTAHLVAPQRGSVLGIESPDSALIQDNRTTRICHDIQDPA